MEDSQIYPKYLLLEIKTIKMSLLLRMKYTIDGSCLFDHC